MSALTKALQKKNWHFRSKDETIKDFKLKIFFLKKTFTHHQTLNPFTPNMSYLPHSYNAFLY